MKKRKNADVNYNLISVEESPVTTSKEQPLELKYDDSQTVKIKTIKPDSQKKKLVKKVIPSDVSLLNNLPFKFSLYRFKHSS